MATLKPKGRSFDQTRSLVSDALKAANPSASYVWVSELYADLVIYTVETSNANPRASQYSATYTIDKDNNVTLGDATAVTQRKVYETVSFSVDTPAFEEADFSKTDMSSEIIKPCLIFRCGKYPEKGLREYSQDDADKILIPDIASFGLRLEDQHPKKDPRTGEVIPNKWTGKLGKGAINAWRVGDDVYANVSFSRLIGEAFKGEKPAVSISIDTATKKPIELSIVDGGYVVGAGVLSEFSEGQEETKPVRNGSVMSFFGTLAEKLGLKESEVKEGIKAEFSNENSELEARLKTLEAENLALKQGQSSFSAVTVAQQANVLADSVILADKATPAERESLVAQFSATLNADAGTGKLAEFSAEGKMAYGPLTTASLAREMARPSLGILGNAEFSVKHMGGGSGDADPIAAVHDKAYAMHNKEGK